MNKTDKVLEGVASEAQMNIQKILQSVLSNDDFNSIEWNSLQLDQIIENYYKSIIEGYTEMKITVEDLADLADSLFRANMVSGNPLIGLNIVYRFKNIVQGIQAEKRRAEFQLSNSEPSDNNGTTES